MSRAWAWIMSHRIAAVAIALVSVGVLSAGLVGVAQATDQPGFCASACHEMQPYHAAWDAGPHADISCVSCHVDPGVKARLSHKVVALKEVWVHVTGEPSFPLAEPAAVPDSRCITCHADIASTTPGFDHAEHAGRGPCASCHPTAGHEVADSALREAGVFNDVASTTRAAESSAVAAVDAGKANLPGHPTVACIDCHDMAATGCASCHEPNHATTGPAEKTAACTTCHEPGVRFAFSHPADPPACDTCHTPATTHTFKGECTTCHKAPGVKWAFSHPKPSSTCTSCHTTPAKHRSGPCATCHATGTSWAFSHPAGGSKCTSCHTRPAKHSTASCTTCHRSGSSWAFRHPGSSATCTSCHKRPSGHRSGSCATCHTVSSWRFDHPDSSRCSSCHKAPSKHYGSSCSSCHSPGKAWSKASFSHPRVPGGEHSYKSFSCASCHPKSYASYSCLKCHDSNSGPSDEDDD